MHIHVIDVLNFQPRIRNGVEHGLFRAFPFRIGSGQVVSIGAHAAAGYLGIDFGPAGNGMLVLFEQQRSGAFSDHEPVAIGIERPRSFLRVVVAGREGLHRIETSDSRRVDRGLGTSRENHVRLAPANVIQRIDHRMVRRSAGRNRTIVRAPETVFHRNVAGSQIRNHLRYEERAISRNETSLDIALYLLVECFQSTYTRSPDNSHAFEVELFGLDPRVLHRLFGGDQRILRIEVVFTHLLAIEEVIRFVTFEFAGKFCLEVRRVKMSNRSCSAYTFFKISEVLLNAVT